MQQLSRPTVQFLHPEILAQIFTFCVPKSNSREAIQTWVHTILLLCNVCSFWRALAITTPRLWTKFYIGLGLQTLKRFSIASIVEHIDMWLGRSGIHPVTIYFYCDAPTRTQKTHRAKLLQACVAISKYVLKWETFDIVTGIPLNSWPALGPAPLLHTLRVHCPSLNGAPFTSAPRLTNFYLSTEPYISPQEINNLPWQQLTNIVIIPVVRSPSLLDLIRSCSHLESLYASVGTGWETTLPYEPPIKHAILRSLDLRLNECYSFFNSLVLPGLSSLCLAHEMEYSCHTELIRLLNKSRCKLEQLTLVDCRFKPYQLLEFLEHRSCETLIELAIKNRNKKLIGIPIVDGELLQRLTYVDGKEEEVLCPKLTDITLHLCRSPPSPGTIGEMILSRCSQHRSLSLELGTWYDISKEDSALLELAKENGLRLAHWIRTCNDEDTDSEDEE